MTLPDLYRYRRSEAGAKRLTIAFFTTQLIALAFYLTRPPIPVPRVNFLSNKAMTAEWLLLIIYGMTRTSGAIAQERAQRTWDFYRLTPLSSYEIMGGKLLGAPIFAYLMGLFFLPWIFIGYAVDHRPWMELPFALWSLLAGTFFFLTLGLLISAYSDSEHRGRNNVGMVVILGYVGFMSLSRMLAPGMSNETVEFYAWRLPMNFFYPISMMAFGLWFFAGASWRLNEDLLEKKRLWHFPAFFIFFSAYLFGFAWRHGHPLGYDGMMLGTSLLVFIAACVNKQRHDYWRYWVSLRGTPDWIHNTPLWITGLTTFIASCGIYTLIENVVLHHATLSVSSLFTFPLFLIRDLCFLQWCRFTRSRMPEGTALLYLTLAYVLPPMLFNSAHHPEWGMAFLPVHNDQWVVYPLRLWPMIAMTTLSAAALGVRLRTVLKNPA